jgi:hypothetical protein
MVLFVPISRDLLVVVVKLRVILAILVIRILSVLCKGCAAATSEDDNEIEGKAKSVRNIHRQILLVSVVELTASQLI